MMRCEHCGGHANLGLAHLHGNPCQPLCHDCTEHELERQKAERDRLFWEREARFRVHHEERLVHRMAWINDFLNKAA